MSSSGKYKMKGSKKLVKDFEEWFNPNNFTDEAMPLSSELFSILSMGVWDKISHKHKALSDSHREINHVFFDSLSKAQEEAFQKYWEAETDEYTLATTESFNKGFKLGARLVMELLK